jgi:hypothetical protein
MISEHRGAVRRPFDESGFTLIELLVASALVIVVIGAVAALAQPVRRAFDRGLGTAELVARARTAVAAVVADARNAGTGVVIGPTDVALADVIAVVAPLSSSSLAITRATGAQGVLRAAAETGARSIMLDTAKACTEQDATCGVRAGDTAVIFDRAKGESIVIAAVTSESATLHLVAPLLSAFDPGAAVAVVERTILTLRDRQLVRVTAAGAEQPIADHIAAFSATVAGNRLDLLLRIEPLADLNTRLELRTSVGLRQ